MRKILFTLLGAFSALFFLPNVVKAEDYTIETIPAPATPVLSAVLPLVPQTSAASSVTQQVFLASELTALGASSGDITGITFYYGGKSNTNAVPSVTRSLKIFITSIAADSIAIHETSGAYVTNYRAKFLNPGTSPVHDGSITTEAIAVGEVKPLSIVFNSSFKWDGASNILLTVFDVTNTAYSSSEANLRFVLKATEHARFAHQYWTASGSGKAEDYLSSLAGLEAYSYTSGSTGTAKEKQVRGHLWVPKTTFTITPSAAAVIPSVPEDLAASSIGSTSASLSWSAVDGATSYDLYNSTSIDGVYAKFASPSSNSFEWSGLTANTTYFVKVAAVNDAGSSDYSDPISFTTLAPHTHDGITFEPWSNPAALPTSGNYFLNTDVALGWESDDVTLTGDLNLCLNGHEADLAFFKIIVPDGKTLAIFDNAGGGKITSFVASEVGAFDVTAKALIVVYNSAELNLHQGIIENTYIPDEDGQSYAIYSNGTLRLSGDVLINSNSADIYLYASNIIRIDGAINNSEKHTIWKNDGIFTSGWSTHMSGENPRDFFESANPARGVCLKDGEAALRTALNLSENSNNSSIGTHYNQTVDVNLTRSLTPSQFNTFCLPFALDDDQLQELFGAGYDLEEFVSSSLEGDVLSLEFSKVTSLEAGKPYLLQPSVDVANPSFEGVTITATAPADQTSDANISFHGTFAPTELAGGNKNLLFLGAGNELFWPEATGNLKGFRAYFEVKGGAAKVAKRARIVQKGEQTQAIDLVENPNTAHKRIIDGQLVIEKNGMIFNAQGQMVK